MRVLLPEVKSSGEICQFKPMSVFIYQSCKLFNFIIFFLKKKEGILPDFMNGRSDGVKLYVNKAPQWNERKQ